MALTEAQIVRFSRQILLRELGGKGQIKLLEGTVRIEGAGPVIDDAVAYLLAGGSPLELPEGFTPGGFLTSVSLSPPGERVGVRGEPFLLSASPLVTAHVALAGPGLAFRRPDACPACWQQTLAALGSTPLEPVPGLGALAALCLQRLVLGWSDPHGLVRWSGERFHAESPRCEAHSNP